MPSEILRKCIECGVEFLSINERKTCSDACRRKRKNRHSVNCHKKYGKAPRGIIGSVKKCLVCGIEYTVTGSKQRYCSERCSKKAKREREKKTALRPAVCKVCGASFMTPRKSAAQTCSTACTAAARRASMAAYNETSGWNDRKVIDPMPCPWATPGKLGTGPEGVSWYSAQADPMTRGVWLEGNLETVREKEVKKCAA